MDDSVAQLVEQYTFNVWVLGSSPSQITKRKLKITKSPQTLRLRVFAFGSIHQIIQLFR